MKKNRGVTIISLTAIVFIFMLIYKQSWLTKLLYEQQQLINQKGELQKESEFLSEQLYRLKDSHHVYHYAQNTLGLQTVAITRAKSIKRLVAHIEDQ